MQQGYDFQCQDLRDEVVQFSDQGGFCGAGGARHCFTKDLNNQQNQKCSGIDVYDCESYSACEVDLQDDAATGECSLVCKAYIPVQDTCEDDCKNIEWNSFNGVGSVETTVEQCKRRCGIVSSIETLKQEAAMLTDKMDRQAFKDTSRSKVELLMDIQDYLLGRLNATLYDRTQLLNTLRLDNLASALEKCAMDRLPTAWQALHQTGGMPMILAAMQNQHIADAGTAINALSGVLNCQDKLYMDIHELIIQRAKEVLTNQRTLDIQRDLFSARKGGYLSAGFISISFCLQDNLNSENFVVMTPRPLNVNGDTLLWARLHNGTRFKCESESMQVSNTFYDEWTGMRNVAGDYRQRSNALMLTQGSHVLALQSTYDPCKSDTDLRRLQLNCAQSGGSSRRLLSSTSPSPTNIVTNTVHKTNKIQRTEHIKCPIGSKRAKWNNVTNSDHGESANLPIGFFACWDAYATNKYFNEEKDLRGGDECTTKTYFDVSPSETADTKLCNNGLKVSSSSICPSSQYTYFKSPNTGMQGFVRNRMYCIPDTSQSDPSTSQVARTTHTFLSIANLVKQQPGSCGTLKAAYHALRQDDKTCCSGM